MRRLASIALLITALIGTLWFAAYRQQTIDWVLASAFKPSPDIAALVGGSGMSEYGRRMFYASQPKLLGRDTFNASCSKQDEQIAAVLGCYTQSRIYVYNVTDPRLNGIKPVTAAHEMLHAAYARLRPSERVAVDRLIMEQYEVLKNDADFIDRIEPYADIPNDDRLNELHSMIGTEVSGISQALTRHYGLYFTDRQTVVDAHQSYSATFRSLKERARQIEKQMEALTAKIDQDKTTYSTEVAGLNRAIQTFNDRAERGDFDSRTEFNRERQRLVARRDQIEALRQSVNQSIESYNILNEELSSIASQTESLNRSLDSTLPPVPGI